MKKKSHLKYNSAQPENILKDGEHPVIPELYLKTMC